MRASVWSRTGNALLPSCEAIKGSESVNSQNGEREGISKFNDSDLDSDPLIGGLRLHPREQLVERSVALVQAQFHSRVEHAVALRSGVEQRDVDDPRAAVA